MENEMKKLDEAVIKIIDEEIAKMDAEPTYIFEKGILLFSGHWCRVEKDGSLTRVCASVVPQIDKVCNVISNLFVAAFFIGFMVFLAYMGAPA